MKIQYHLSKISWTVADKLIFVVYGFVFLIQISMLKVSDLALFNMLIAMNTWIFVISDSYALQSIIQFGFDINNRERVNLYSLILHISIVGGLSFLIYSFSDFTSILLNEPRLEGIIDFLPILSLLMVPRTYTSKLMLRDHSMRKIFIMDFFFLGVMSFRIMEAKLSGLDMTLEYAVNIYLQGAAASSLSAIFLSLKQLKFSLKGDISFKKVNSFSMPFTMTNAINTIPKYLDIVILKIFFPLEQIGLYAAAKSLFKFFEEGMHGVNGLLYPAAVRAVFNKDKEALYSMVSKALSFTLLGFMLVSIVLVSGFAELLISRLMKSNFLDAVGYFNLILLAGLFLPFNLLYFVITASEKYADLLKIVIKSFIFFIISFVVIGISGISKLMPLGYVSFYLAFAVMSFYYVKKSDIIDLKFADLFRAVNDSIKFISMRFLDKARGN